MRDRACFITLMGITTITIQATGFGVIIVVTTCFTQKLVDVVAGSQLPRLGTGKHQRERRNIKGQTVSAGILIEVSPVVVDNTRRHRLVGDQEILSLQVGVRLPVTVLLRCGIKALRLAVNQDMGVRFSPPQLWSGVRTGRWRSAKPPK